MLVNEQMLVKLGNRRKKAGLRILAAGSFFAHCGSFSRVVVWRVLPKDFGSDRRAARRPSAGPPTLPSPNGLALVEVGDDPASVQLNRLMSKGRVDPAALIERPERLYQPQLEDAAIVMRLQTGIRPTN